jgi:hypothetical protein
VGFEEITQVPQVDAFGSVGSAAALVATVSQYLFAPETADHVKVGFSPTPVLPSVGAVNAGAGRRRTVRVTGTVNGELSAPGAEMLITPL